MDPLGDCKEFCVAADHQPTDVYVGITRVTDEHLKHLGHPTPGRGGADIPDGLVREAPACSVSDILKLAVAILSYE